MAKPTKYGNIYDVDGNLVRHCNERGEQVRWTIEETEKLVDELTAKVKDNPDNEVYKVYLNNAQKTLFAMYNNMSREELMKRLTILQDSVKEAQTRAKTDEENNLEELNLSIDKIKQLYEENTPENAVEEPLKIVQNDPETGENTEDEVQGSTPGDRGHNGDEESGDVEAVGREQSNLHEARSLSQSDLLVERTNVTNNMDEYVSPIGESSDEYTNYEEVA